VASANSSRVKTTGPRTARACFCGGWPQLPLLLGFLDTTALDKTAVIIIIKGLQRFLDRGVRQEHRLTPWSIVFPISLAYHHGIERVRLEIPAVVL
jgi:hypothetical protein